MGFNLKDVFPELIVQDFTNPFPPRPTFWIKFENNNDNSNQQTVRDISMEITIRQQIILAIQSSPQQCMTTHQMWNVIQRMNPMHANKGSIRSGLSSSDEFEQVTKTANGTIYRWRRDRMQVRARPRYRGSKLDEILRDQTHGYKIVVENMKIKKIDSVNLQNH